MISLKLEKTFLEDIDCTAKNQNYQNRTEFIRSALREKIEKTKLKEAMIKLSELKGKTQKTSSKRYEDARKKAFEAIEQELR